MARETLADLRQSERLLGEELRKLGIDYGDAVQRGDRLEQERDKLKSRTEWLESSRQHEIDARVKLQDERDELAQRVSMLEADLSHERGKLGMAEALVGHLRAEKSHLERGVLGVLLSMGAEAQQPADPFALDNQAWAFIPPRRR